MEETTFAADPMRLMIAAAVGIVQILLERYAYSEISGTSILI